LHEFLKKNFVEEFHHWNKFYFDLYGQLLNNILSIFACMAVLQLSVTYSLKKKQKVAILGL
jgi:hypothetical protein